MLDMTSHNTGEAVIVHQIVQGSDASLLPVLYLHGALGTKEQFTPYLERFSERTQYLLDLPSHGGSTTEAAMIDTQWLADETLRMMDHWGIERADIIGYSMGGYVGLEMAVKQPSRVRSVVSHAMKYYWTPESIASSLNDLQPEVLKSRSEKAHAALSKMHAANGLERTMELSRGLIENFTSYGLDTSVIKEAKVPVLLSVGDRDELVPLAEILRLYEELGYDHASLAIHPNTRHQFHFLAPDSFERVIRQFWSKLS
jgi:pimeloyl-ACP methyl ester carboxylesterase